MEDFTQTITEIFRNAEARLLKHTGPPPAAAVATAAAAATQPSDEMDFHSKKTWNAIKNYKKRT